mgnify:CR=1 FL=1
MENVPIKHNIVGVPHFAFVRITVGPYCATHTTQRRIPFSREIWIIAAFYKFSCLQTLSEFHSATVTAYTHQSSTELSTAEVTGNQSDKY